MENCSSRPTDTYKVFSKKQVETDHLDINYMQTSIATDELGLQKFDTYDGKEQTSILNYYKKLSNGNFLSWTGYSRIKSVCRKRWPLQPLLYIGSSGVGQSFILSHWISCLQLTLFNTCILYHFVVGGSINSSWSKLTTIVRWCQ